MKIISVTALILAASIIGCASSSEPTAPSSSSGSSGASGSTGIPDDGTSSGEASSGTPTPTPPPAPTVSGVAKMMGALHVMWTNTEAACTTIEGERKADMADGSNMEKYKVVFTVPGEADNKHDTTATDAMKYTYRLRCKKGDVYSAYSNEMSGNPK